MTIKTSVDIVSKPQEVFSWVENPVKAMCWQKGVKSQEVIKETAERTGTIFKEELQENGKSLVMQGEITNYLPGRLVSFHLVSKIHEVDVTYSVTTNAHISILSVDSTIKWKFPMNVISLFTGRKMKAAILKQTDAELMELKRLCEASNN